MRRPLVWFAAAFSLGIALSRWTVLGVAAWAREYIAAILAWIEAHWVPGTLVMVALVGIYRWRRRAPSAHMED